MRLLRLEADGRASLSEWQLGNIPPYAILSHTWGNNGDEVTYEDINNGTGKEKHGYRKIDFCGKQAASDGFQYFWVDTCCINKANNTELFEAINSMFRWYQNAVRCYVFLSDVLNPSELSQSRWFTRGWTLQELIAPRIVEFFSSEGRRLGDKESLENQIHAITRVKIPALRGDPLSSFTVVERMEWSRERQTTIPEDNVYCLFGIFDVYLPLIYGEGSANARSRLVEAIEKRAGISHDAPNKAKPESHFVVPFGQNEEFVGREDILAELFKRIPPSTQKNNCQRTAIEGLGGIGKTQIALQAAFQVYEQYPDCSVYWVPVVSQITFENAYREIGNALHVPGMEDEKADVKSLVKAALERSKRCWLLIIDNADDSDLVFGDVGGFSAVEWLPFSRNGSLLFTTRNHQVTARLGVSRTNTLQLQRMSDTEATEMLQKGLEPSQLRDTESTMALIHSLENLPLAIKQACAYMAENQTVSTADYLRYYRSSNEEQIHFLTRDFRDQNRYDGMANAIAKTWLISFENISKRNPLAIRFLKLTCLVAEEDIPISLFDEEKNERVMREAIATLIAYAFITQRQEQDWFDIHGLVRLVTRNGLGQKRQEYVTAVTQRLARIYPWPEYSNRQTWIKYIPHAQAVLEIRKDCTDARALIRLLTNVAESSHKLFRYSEAEEMYRQVVELKQKIYGSDHPGALGSMNDLAIILGHQRKYVEAEEMDRKTLELREKILGRDHPEILDSMNNLALVFKDQGKYVEAEEMIRKTLELKEKILGRDHPKILDSMSNLALVFKDQGKYVEAEEMIRKTLELMEKILGRDHPNTLISMYNLGLVLAEQRKYAEAEEILRQTLEQREKILGPEHPDTLVSMNNVGSVFQDQGKYVEAEEMIRKTLELMEKILGRDHPDTLISMNNLGSVLAEQRKYAEAEEILRQTLEQREKILGPEHPDTLVSMILLAHACREQGKLAEAEAIFQQVLPLLEKVLGSEHQFTVLTKNIIGPA
ncbi:hypothetical protein BX600DRAFT_478139 [Xylariales sp. PMI_506]|nr:hypothetical protein BX600DRAFT_478139 [Xylariales sp. PMI_506]